MERIIYIMLSEKNNILCINSFPRTGNTFLQQNIETFIKKNNIQDVYLISHTHDHLMILNDNLNQVSILRHPLETITSFVLMYIPSQEYKINDEILKLIDDSIYLYIQFIMNMSKNKNIYIIKFNDLIKLDINKIIYDIFYFFNIPIKKQYIKNTSLDFFTHVELNKTKNQENYYSLNYPKTYIKEKEDLIKEIIKSKGYSDALLIYKNFFELPESRK